MAGIPARDSPIPISGNSAHIDFAPASRGAFRKHAFAENQFMPERFLIVDDDADSTFLARRNLQNVFPHAVVEHVQSGPAALDLLREHEFTAIVTDYRMPWMDGLTLVRKIREMNLHMPIIMRTAMEDLEDAARAAGGDYVLPWFRWRELGEVVKELLHCNTPGSTPSGNHP
jgi:two-component system chemotaxis response regulator CheY